MAKKTTSKGKRTGGPFVACACFCDQVLQDKDGSLTAVRMLDQVRLLIPASAPADFPSKENRLPVQLQGLLSFKTGGYPGAQHQVRIVMESPSGKTSQVIEQTIAFTEIPEGGGNLVLRNILLTIFGGGLFYFDVYLDDKWMTRMPLRITYEREQPPQVTPVQLTSNSVSEKHPRSRNRRKPR